MIVQYDPDFLDKLKSVDLRIRKSFNQKIEIFRKDPYNPEFDNHKLQREYQGYRSINITDDYRALYEEVPQKRRQLPIFLSLGLIRNCMVIKKHCFTSQSLAFFYEF